MDSLIHSYVPILGQGDGGNPAPGGVPPVFTYEPQNAVVERGGSKFLLCSADGDPVPDIRWLNKGNVLFESLPGTGYSYLAINDFQATDSYTCQAYNPYGQITRSVTVTLDEGGAGTM